MLGVRIVIGRGGGGAPVWVKAIVVCVVGNLWYVSLGV
jgi:hypothetical protein